MREEKIFLNNILAAINTFGIVYASNTSSAIELFRNEDSMPKCDKHFTAGDTAIVDWLKMPVFEGRRLYKPAGECIIDRGDNKYTLVMHRLMQPTNEDYDAFVAWTGCSCYEEAQCYYGDMSPMYTRIAIDFVGYNTQWLKDIVPYCW